MSGCPGPGQEPGTQCGRTVHGRGLCNAHYLQRWKDPDRPLRPVRRNIGPSPLNPDGEPVKRCSLCDQSKPLDMFVRDKNRNDGRSSHCKACHSERVRRYKAENAELVKSRELASRRAWEASAPECSVPGCRKPAKYRHHLCSMHEARLRRHGDVYTVKPRYQPPIGEDNPTWAGDKIGYFGMHARLRRYRGNADTYSCVDCGGRASQWSYDHNDPEERWEMMADGVELPYSVNAEHYEPRCVPCHSTFDFAHGQERRADH